MSEPSRRQVDAARRAYGQAREKGESPDQAMAKALVAAATLGPVHTPAAVNQVLANQRALQDRIDANTKAWTQGEKLRELVAYCREREVYKGRDGEIGADTAYGDVADQLAGILGIEGS